MSLAYVSFGAEINPTTTETLLVACCNLANQGVQEICLLLSTPGGSVMNGINAYNVLRGLPVTLTTHNVGAVNSIGNVLFLAGQKRFACPASTFMFHGVGFDVTAAMRFEEKGLRERLDAVKADQAKIAAILGDRGRFREGEIDGLFLEAATKDVSFAKERGLIDEIRDVQIPPGTPVHQLVFKR